MIKKSLFLVTATFCLYAFNVKSEVLPEAANSNRGPVPAVAAKNPVQQYVESLVGISTPKTNTPYELSTKPTIPRNDFVLPLPAAGLGSQPSFPYNFEWKLLEHIDGYWTIFGNATAYVLPDNDPSDGSYYTMMHIATQPSSVMGSTLGMGWLQTYQNAIREPGGLKGTHQIRGTLSNNFTSVFCDETQVIVVPPKP